MKKIFISLFLLLSFSIQAEKNVEDDIKHFSESHESKETSATKFAKLYLDYGKYLHANAAPHIVKGALRLVKVQPTDNFKTTLAEAGVCVGLNFATHIGLTKYLKPEKPIKSIAKEATLLALHDGAVNTPPLLAQEYLNRRDPSLRGECVFNLLWNLEIKKFGLVAGTHLLVSGASVFAVDWIADYYNREH